jgi:hypothetical protein
VGANPGFGGRGWLAALGVALTVAAAAEALAEDGFEAPAHEARDLLPAELLRGPHHRVEPEVGSDGFLPVFGVSSDFGRYEARGEAALRETIREIEALAALRESAAEGGSAAPPAPGQPGAPALPGRPLAGLPAGAWGAGQTGGAGLALGGPGGAAGFRDLEAMRREVASRLGIDPYTENAELQQELQRHVWATWAGRLSSPFVDADAAGAEPEPVLDAPERPDALVRDYSEEDLRRLYRIELAVMGVEEPLREAFLEHPHYTSRHGARILDSLAELEHTADRSAFIEAAVAADSEEEARGFERMAELLRRYGEQTGSLDRFLTIDGRVAAHASDGTLIVPVLAEHGAWTRGVASFAQSLARATGGDPELAGTRLLVSGSLSDRARSEMEDLGLRVTEQGLAEGP